MHMSCWPKILVRDCGLASALCLMMLKYCQESGLGPIHVCMGTTVPMNRSVVWLGLWQVVGSSLRGLIQGVQTILSSLWLIWLTCGYPSMLPEHQIYSRSLECTRNGLNLYTKKTIFRVPGGKTYPCKIHNVSLQGRKVQLLGHQKWLGEKCTTLSFLVGKILPSFGPPKFFILMLVI